ncbi:MAG: DNA-3-methyladenine glycosylase I, partial [Alphaproteobacteria bacterium]
IDAAISGARIFLDMREAGEDFSTFLWSFTDGRPIQTFREGLADVPAETPLSREIAAALKARGFRFAGPVIVYAFMQAVGMVNDHLVSCHRHASVLEMGG